MAEKAEAEDSVWEKWKSREEETETGNALKRDAITDHGELIEGKKKASSGKTRKRGKMTTTLLKRNRRGKVHHVNFEKGSPRGWKFSRRREGGRMGRIKGEGRGLKRAVEKGKEKKKSS